MLQDGEIALLAGEGLEPIDAVAHELGLVSVRVVRSEGTPERQDETVMAYAASMPLVWVAERFSPTVSGWARARGPMTLLVGTDGPLPEHERRRIDRFVASLDRQSE
jgi:hypothetical protein